MNKLIQIEKIESKQLIEVSKWEDIQNKIIKENPFIEIVDNATYLQAKHNRTALLKGRTSLLGSNGQENIIRTKFKTLLSGSMTILTNLAGMTEPKYEEQQAEVKRWEQIKIEEKAEKLRVEEKRVSDIKAKITDIYNTWVNKINELTFDKIQSCLIIDTLDNQDTSGFGGFVLDFEERKLHLIKCFEEKSESLRIERNQKIESDRLEKERKEFEETQRIAREKTEKEEEQRKEAQRSEDEKRAKEQAKIDAENKKKSDELTKKEKENKAKEDRLNKIESDRIAREQALKNDKIQKENKAKEEKRIKELQPDIVKLSEIINSIQVPASEIPDLKYEKAKDFLGNIQGRIKLLKEELLTELNNVN